LYPVASPGPATRRRVAELLGFIDETGLPSEVKVETTWEADGLLGEEISWSVGYGPRTRAFVLRPADHSGPLPGVLALHDHSGFKYLGKEKIADGPEGPLASVLALRNECYGGRAFVNALAREGFVVLAHDTFAWGSRRFPRETMERQLLLDRDADDVAGYNVTAALFEHVLEKNCALMGTTFAGVLAHEDRIALSYLSSRPDVSGRRVGTIGLSGGGSRAALMAATAKHLSATVVVGMMSTYPSLLNRHVETHSWMFFPPGLARFADWPDVAASRAPTPLLVQYDRDDALFPQDGMEAAHERIAGHYRRAGAAEAYLGQFYDGPHKFDLEMQESRTPCTRSKWLRLLGPLGGPFRGF